MKAVLLAFVACMALCHVAIAFPAQSERSIKSDTEQKKQVSVAQKLLSSAVQPYAAFLFFRQGLTDEDMSPVTPRCQQDADCESGASFCSVSGECKPTLSIKSHCSRDQECSTGFCSKATLTGNRCLTKRLEGQACGASPTSACGEGLFCALGELRCRQQRGLHQACRSTNACAEGLACVNYHCQESHKPTKTTQEIAFQAMMKKRSFKHQPSGSWDQPHWFGKREGESDAQAEKRNFWPQPSGSWDQPHWFAKREGESDDQAEKRNFWPQPSGSWDHPHWLTVKREEASSGADNEKRNFWPQPSGSWDHPHWFARREEYGQPDSPVELRSLAEE